MEQLLERHAGEGELPWIQASKAAEILGIPRGRIYRMIQRGQLASRPDPLNPRGVLVDRDQVETMLAELREIEGNGAEE